MPKTAHADDSQVVIIEDSKPTQKEANELLAEEKGRLQALEQNVEEIKGQHLQIARLLQAQGIDAIHKQRARIFRFKEAMESIKAGVELERKVLGLDSDNNAPIVNIIANQQGIISKYVEEEEEENSDKKDRL